MQSVSALDDRMIPDPGLTPGACWLDIDVRVSMPRPGLGTQPTIPISSSGPLHHAPADCIHFAIRGRGRGPVS